MRPHPRFRKGTPTNLSAPAETFGGMIFATSAFTQNKVKIPVLFFVAE
jgi:hypothetical protein